MSRAFKIYIVVWTICFGLFNVIAFVFPSLARFSGSFWIGYIFVALAFVGQLLCSRYALKNNDERKQFYIVSSMLVSYFGVAAMLVISGVVMLIPSFPMWLGLILCLGVLALSTIAVVIAGAAGGIVGSTDKKTRIATYTFRTLAADAEHLMSEARSADLRAETKKVYEAIRYSDVVSNSALIEINERIQRQFAAFSDAVKDGDAELSSAVAGELLSLIDERNKKCRLFK